MSAVEIEGKKTRRTDTEVMAALGSGSPLDRARSKFSSFAARIEQDGMQRNPSGPIEILRIQFEAVDEIAAALGVPELIAALTEVSLWISNWSPNFEQDDEWPETAARMKAAIAKATSP
jgi:hypothetical protein